MLAIILNFFLTFHRSILDPKWCLYARYVSGKRITHYLLVLLCTTTFVAGIANTWHCIRPHNGLPSKLEKVFDNVSIDNGYLRTSRPLPFTPQPLHVTQAMETLLRVPELTGAFAESLIVFAPQSFYDSLSENTTVKMVLLDSQVVFYPLSPFELRLSYAQLFPDNPHIDFSEKEIHSYLKRHSGYLLLNYWIHNGLLTGFIIILSIVFLSVPPYLLGRKVGAITFTDYCKCAAFSVSPIPFAGMLVAIAGVAVQSFPITFLISAIVFFRGITALFIQMKKNR
jgi:hypothetical protein